VLTAAAAFCLAVALGIDVSRDCSPTAAALWFAVAGVALLALAVIFPRWPRRLAVHVLNLYFGWPAGAVYSNLLASAICAVLVYWRLRVQMIAHHAEALAQAARHHAERLKQAADNHEELKAHITATVPRPPARTAKTLARKPAKDADV
jgi:hypothetical protein